eukprot:4556399-Amphidinium_carterae.1
MPHSMKLLGGPPRETCWRATSSSEAIDGRAEDVLVASNDYFKATMKEVVTSTAKKSDGESEVKRT